jgi:hypothetical protein
MRQSENDVKIRYAEHFLLTSSETSLARLRLTLWAMPIPAGVIGNGLMAALRTGIEMAAQCRRAAAGNRSQHCQLLEAQPRSILVQKAGLVRAKDIGHLHGRPAHSGFCSLRDRFSFVALET